MKQEVFGGRVGGQTLAKDFQGDFAVEDLVVGAVNHTHAAFTDFRGDAIVSEKLADHGACASGSVPRWECTPGLAIFETRGNSGQEKGRAACLACLRCRERPGLARGLY